MLELLREVTPYCASLLEQVQQFLALETQTHQLPQDMLLRLHHDFQTQRLHNLCKLTSYTSQKVKQLGQFLCSEEAACECELVVKTGDSLLHRWVDLSAQFVSLEAVTLECLLMGLVFDECMDG